MIRRTRILGVALFAAMIVTPGAAAHARFLRSVPASGAALPRAPAQIVVFFDEAVRVGPGNRAIANSGDSILLGAPFTRGNTLVLPLKAQLKVNDYSVRWSAISDDGHTEQGVLAFSIGKAPPPHSVLRADNGTSATSVVLRWAFILLLLAAGGLSLFGEAVYYRVTREPVPRALLATLLAGVAALAGALLVHSGAGVTTRFGICMAAAAASSAAASIAAASSSHRPTLQRIAGLVAIGLLVTPTLSGHALDAGNTPLDAAFDLAHVVASAFWVGSVLAITVVMRDPSITPTTRAALVRGFARLAVATVAVIAATGVARALSELASASQVWTTGYGRALLAKSTLFAIALGLGWLSRSLLRSKTTSPRRVVTTELGVLIAIIGFVGVLTTLPPGTSLRTAAASAERAPEAVKGVAELPPGDALALGQRDGTLAAALSVRPDGEAVATFIRTDGLAADVGSVTIAGRVTRSCGTGCYRGHSPTRGTVVVAHGKSRLTFHLATSTDATALLREVTRRYQRQRSVSYDQRIDSGLGTSVIARWQEMRPSSFTYRIRGAASAIVIGRQRWDRDQGKPWEHSTTTPSTTLEPLWGTSRGLTNARLIGHTSARLEIAFMGANRVYPAWFRVVVARKTLRVIHVQMTAAAHFMTAQYRTWDTPLRIRPPQVGR